MLTRAEAKKQRREIDRQIAADLKAKARKKLAELRAQVDERRRERRDRVKAARFACGRSRRLLALRRKERRARLLAELRELAAQERRAAKERCDVGRRAAKTAGEGVKSAAARLAEERRYQRELARIERNNRRTKWTAIKTATRAERQSESDDEVASNLDPELVPLWERVKRSIKGSSRRSRTEAFLEYASANPGEVLDAQGDRTDALIRELEAKVRKVRPYTRKRKYTAAELAEVPF